MGHPILRQAAKRLSNEEIVSDRTAQLIDDMWQMMHQSDGIGLAAPQIGISKQIAVIQLPDTSPRYPDAPKSPAYVLFNPTVSVLDPTLQTFTEGCLSLPGLHGLVSRPRKVRIDYQDQQAKKCSLQVEDFLATVFQHELDHLIGKLYIDRMKDLSSLAFNDALATNDTTNAITADAAHT